MSSDTPDLDYLYSLHSHATIHGLSGTFSTVVIRGFADCGSVQVYPFKHDGEAGDVAVFAEWVWTLSNPTVTVRGGERLHLHGAGSLADGTPTKVVAVLGERESDLIRATQPTANGTWVPLETLRQLTKPQPEARAA